MTVQLEDEDRKGSSFLVRVEVRMLGVVRAHIPRVSLLFCASI